MQRCAGGVVTLSLRRWGGKTSNCPLTCTSHVNVLGTVNVIVYGHGHVHDQS
jgi:hypothetical protein